MTVLHIGYTYGFDCTGGAAIAASKLHNFLLDEGIDSHFLCVVKTDEGRNVIQYPPEGSLWRIVHQALARIERNVWRFTSYRKKHDINIVPLFIHKIVGRLKPDIIQVHQIGAGMIRFEELRALRIPLLLTLHDFRLINGFDPYPYDDQRIFVGFTKKNSSRLERWLWCRKLSLARNSNVSFVAPSEWAANVARRSVCGKNKDVHVVPYFIGPEFKYCPEKRSPHQKFRIVFGCNCGMTNPFKGFSDLRRAIELLPSEIQRETELHVFGDTVPDFMIGKVQVRVRGILKGAAALCAMYHEGDVFAFPSKTETQGMTKIEAMLCGLPVVAFDRTACPESIRHEVNGWIADDNDIAGFAAGLRHFFNQWKSGVLDASREGIASGVYEKYSNAVIMKRVLDVYDSVLNGS